jgi:uncharacterized protein (TIRG00374 family)
MLEGIRAVRAGRIVLSYGIAAVCLVWVFHDVRFGDLFRNLESMNWGWVALAVVFDILSYVCQGWRWGLLLHARGGLSAAKATQAVYAGLFVNEILPMRVGEVLRTYLAARWVPTDISCVVSSILVERFFDALWLMLLVGITILAVPLPHYLIEAEEILAAIVFASTALLIFLVMRPPRKALEEAGTPEHPGLLHRILAVIGKLATGIRDIGRSRYFYSSLAISSLVLIFQIIAFWLVMWAYGLRLSVWHGAAILLIVHIGTVIPSAPSNVGTYQFFTVLGLTQFAVSKTTATGFSVVVFLILTIPLWVIGILAFLRAGLSLHQVRAGMTLAGDRVHT